MKKYVRMISMLLVLVSIFSVLSVVAFADTNGYSKSFAKVTNAKNGDYYQVDFTTTGKLANYSLKQLTKMGYSLRDALYYKAAGLQIPTVTIKNTGSYALHVYTTYRYGTKDFIITPGNSAKVAYDYSRECAIQVKFEKEKNNSFDLWLPRWAWNSINPMVDDFGLKGSFEIRPNSGYIKSFSFSTYPIPARYWNGK